MLLKDAVGNTRLLFLLSKIKKIIYYKTIYMKQLVSTKFFRTLCEASQTGIDIDANTLQNEYDDFAKSVFLEGKAATNKNDYLDTLIYTRVELSGLTVVSGKKYSNISCKSH